MWLHERRSCPSFFPKELLEFRARPSVLLEEPVHSADLFLVAGQGAPIPRIEKVQKCERTLRVLSLGVLELAEDDGPELGSGCTVPRLDSLKLGNGLAACIAERYVPLSTTRIFTSQRLDKRPLTLVVRIAAASLRQTAGQRNRQAGDQRCADDDREAEGSGCLAEPSDKLGSESSPLHCSPAA